MEPNVSLSHSKQHYINVYPEPDEFNPHPPTSLTKILIIYSHHVWRVAGLLYLFTPIMSTSSKWLLTTLTIADELNKDPGDPACY
jgi:hypothetical protein